ncbi:MAG: preprotein translocase subunit SecG [Ferruginibacter sp.]
MLALFGVLIILASVILGLIVLIQNPKGGGLSGTLGGFSNQLMGVKQTTDVLEKGTWVFASVVGLLCLMSPAFIPKEGKGGSKNDDLLNNMSTSAPAAAPATAPAKTTPMPGTAADSGKK